MLVQTAPLTPAPSPLEERLALFTEVLGELALGGRVENQAVIVQIAPENNRAALSLLRDDPRTTLDVLSFVTAVDRTPREPRFDIVYELYSVGHRHRCRVKTELADALEDSGRTSIDSVADIFLTANWHERECFDLFGIAFTGHPDPRRILLPDRWDGHPLRREYPVMGKAAWAVGTTVVDAVEADANLGLQ